MTNLITFQDKQDKAPGFYTQIEIGTAIHRTTLKAKLDTVAARTLISVGALSSKYSIQGRTSKEREGNTKLQQIKINNTFSEYSNYTTRLLSASGQIMQVLAVEAQNVLIGNVRPDKFFYWLYLSPLNKVLIGYDFIRACKLFHDAGGDFIAQNFEYEEYVRHHNALQNFYLSQEVIEKLIY